MRERRLTARPVGLDSGQLLLICAAGMLTVAGIAHTAAVGLTDARVAIGFGALIAAGELARLTMPGNREVAPISTAASLGYALLLDVGGRGEPLGPAGRGGDGGRHDRGRAAASGGRQAAASRRDGPAAARRVVARLRLPAAQRPAGELARDTDRHGNWWPALGVMAVLVTVMLAADVVIAAMLRADQVRTAFGVAVRDEIRMGAPLGAAVAASGILLALASHSMDMTALPAFAAPLLVTQVAFRKYAGIRATYLQTVRALSRVTEVGGYVEPGHSRRVSQLSVAIGRELGMAEPQLLELEYAALMHDIGQLSLRDPIPGGATVLADPAQARQIAELGAEVIRKTGVLHSVAEIVRRQCETLGESPPIASRIIKAANAYDDLVGGSTDRDRAAAALERLRLDGGTAYDPGVVEAMARVVDRLVLVTRL